ncbi:hypothetical protein DFH06DRAFT_1212001 [Mycena polygramma]|nr:hypothetical protein DFH06DRAFT_1212001 [Mycena polygramma]
MANHLPDEIISEILSPALKIPDEMFSDTSTNSPFAAYSESSSAFLLVSKAWLRVATPLLYHVVVLRSKAQAAALDIALRANPMLGRFIKKLRVEGGYGAPILKIIKAAPNVTDLFVSTTIWSADNVSGLAKGLPLLDPARVVLFADTYNVSRNKNSQIVLDTVKQCLLKEWKNLTIVELSDFLTGTLPELLSSLREAPALETLVIPATRYFNHYHDVISRISSLKTLQFKKSSRSYSYTSIEEATSAALKYPNLRRLIKVPNFPNNEPALGRNPTPPPFSPKPLQYSTESVPEEIWNRIVSFAMTLDVENPDYKPKPRLGIVLVSKKFARLALPYLKETLVFPTPFAFEDAMSRLRDDPSQVRSLYFHTTASMNLRSALSMPLVNIIGLIPLAVTLKNFGDLAKKCGSTLVRLEGLQVAKSARLEDPALLSLFTSLRSFSVGFKASFSSSSPVPSGALAALEQLTLTNCELSFMKILSQMDLPVLRHAAFHDDLRHTGVSSGLRAFLIKHGSKLRTLTVAGTQNVVNLCPGIVDLTVLCGKSVRISSSGLYSYSGPNTLALETITFKLEGRMRGAEKKWATFFDPLNISTFPALRQISNPCIRWPTTEHDIAKSSWVRWAEDLLDHNVKLIDGKGVGWRRRLKK